LNAILASTHHLLASAHCAVTTAGPAESKYIREILDRHKKLVVSYQRGIMPLVHGVHNQFLSEPVAVSVIVDLIRTITARCERTPPVSTLRDRR
jgi:hypothetical protein